MWWVVGAALLWVGQEVELEDVEVDCAVVIAA